MFKKPLQLSIKLKKTQQGLRKTDGSPISKNGAHKVTILAIKTCEIKYSNKNMKTNVVLYQWHFNNLVLNVLFGAKLKTLVVLLIRLVLAHLHILFSFSKLFQKIYIMDYLVVWGVLFGEKYSFLSYYKGFPIFLPCKQDSVARNVWCLQLVQQLELYCCHGGKSVTKE